MSSVLLEEEAADASGDSAAALPPRKKPRMLSKACETCKSKKSRCDSSRPRCDTCRRKGVECVYKEKGQPGLRPGYGKAIESRLTTLEANMERMAQSIQDVLGHVRTGGGFAASHSLQTPEHDPSSAPGGLIGAEGGGGGAQLWPAGPAPPSQQGLPASGGVDPHWQATPTTIDQMPPVLDVAEMSDMASGLPPEGIMRDLVEIFFALVYPWAPLFYKPNFLANLFAPDRQILLHAMVVVAFRFWPKPHPPPPLRDAYVQSSRDRILLKTIDACTLVSTQALVLLAIDTMGQGPGPKVWNVMSMLVTAAKHLQLARCKGSGGGGGGASGAGAAAQHEEPADTPLVRNEDLADEVDLGVIEAEERRRLFWTLFSLDRFSSTSHGQPGGIDPKAVKLPYPVREDEWESPPASQEWFNPTVVSAPSWRSSSSLGLDEYPAVNLWRHNIDLLSLLDRCNQMLIQPVDYSLPAHCQEWQSNFRRLDVNLATWYEGLPRQVREQPAGFDPMWVTVHATFYLISIRMYTVAAFPSTNSPYLRPSASARTRCRQAVRNVASLTSTLLPTINDNDATDADDSNNNNNDPIDRLGPSFAFVIWVAARSLIILWTSGYESVSSSSGAMMPADLEHLLGVLRRCGRRWPCARRYADLIQVVLDNRGSGGPGGSGSGGLDIFNDTRHTAYGLQDRLLGGGSGRLPGGRFRAPEPSFWASSTSLDFLDIMMPPFITDTVGGPDLGGPPLRFGGAEFDGEWL